MMTFRVPWPVRLPVAAAVFCLLCVLTPGPAIRAEEDPAPTAPRAAEKIRASTWKKIKKALPHVLWEQPGNRRARERARKEWEAQAYGASRLSREQFEELAHILRAGNPFTTEKKRSLTLDIPTGSKRPDGGDEVMPVRVAVSSKYKPGCGRSFPLIVTCHGGPMADLAGAVSASGTQFGLWSSYSSVVDCIVAAPALTGSGYGQREWTFLTNLIDELDRRYNVDRDCILLTGHSWGGILTWHLGPSHADTFCTLAPFVCAVNPGRAHLSNCRALPIYHVQGEKDHEWMLKTGRERNEILDTLGYEHVYRERPGGHVSFPNEVRKISKWFMERPRRLYAKALVRTISRRAPNSSDDWYWIRSRTHAFKAQINSEARVIDVDITGPFEVFLADDMLDLDAPLGIRRNGEFVWEGLVQRRLDFTLTHVRETGDRARIFAASVKVP